MHNLSVSRLLFHRRVRHHTGGCWQPTAASCASAAKPNASQNDSSEQTQADVSASSSGLTQRLGHTTLHAGVSSEHLPYEVCLSPLARGPRSGDRLLSQRSKHGIAVCALIAVFMEVLVRWPLACICPTAQPYWGNYFATSLGAVPGHPVSLPSSLNRVAPWLPTAKGTVAPRPVSLLPLIASMWLHLSATSQFPKLACFANNNQISYPSPCLLHLSVVCPALHPRPFPHLPKDYFVSGTYTEVCQARSGVLNITSTHASNYPISALDG